MHLSLNSQCLFYYCYFIPWSSKRISSIYYHKTCISAIWTVIFLRLFPLIPWAYFLVGCLKKIKNILKLLLYVPITPDKTIFLLLLWLGIYVSKGLRLKLCMTSTLSLCVLFTDLPSQEKILLFPFSSHFSILHV